MKKFLKVFLAVVICLIVAAGLTVGGFFLLYSPSITADFSQKTGAVTSGASGYLYGLAEKGVPSANMTESVDISTVSQKVAGGLQHPIGDIDHVYTQLDNTDYNVVYLQDAYSTWYYETKNIEKMRSEGTYDWRAFIEQDYFPRVKDSVEYLMNTSYGDKVVYCLYNECDNGVWFGETVDADWAQYKVVGEFNEKGASNFFEAWKMTYDYVKSINPNAIIGGPGYCDFDVNEMTAFMTYCSENDCVPEIMIYHELGDFSIRFWEQHINDYRAIEKSLGVPELPIIITEYGRMCDNGYPGKMVQYVTRIEDTKVYGDNAYWRLANNLCDVAADDNSPNANWWLYRWYADMEGQTVKTTFNDLFMSNFENAFIKRKEPYVSWGFMGVVSITDSEDEINVVCGGREGSAVVKLRHLDKTALKGKTVKITIEETVYKGISGVVNAPVVQHEYYTKAGSGLNIDINDMDEANAYHITVVAVDEKGDSYRNDTFSKRYEFEEGTLLGNAYTYDSAYATSGLVEGMVGGMENEGDGVELTFSVPEDDTYNLEIIYGNSNDGPFNEETGKQNPSDRVASTSLMTVDGNETEMSFPNTIKSEYTDCIPFCYELTKGEHTISFKHIEGTIVLDSLIISKISNDDKPLAVLKDSDRTTESIKSYLAVAPTDGYYQINVLCNSPEITGYVDGAKFSIKTPLSSSFSTNTVYLKRGLNYIDFESDEPLAELSIYTSEVAGECYTIEAQSCMLTDGAHIAQNDKLNVKYIDGISSNGGKAEAAVNVEKAGTYAITFLYSNNEEGGHHDYNVDLVERYITVAVNGAFVDDVFCRNTYSWDIYKTVTVYAQLNAGANTITLTNSGRTSFNSNVTYCPYISQFSVNQVNADYIFTDAEG